MAYVWGELRARGNNRGLGFDGSDDLLDHVRKTVEYGNRWLAAYNFNVAERYEKLDIEIICQIRVGGSEEYQFVFHAIPMGDHNRKALGWADHLPDMESVFCDEGDGLQHPVTVYAREGIHGPEKIIPSLVRLGHIDNRQDFRRDLLAADSPCVFVMGQRRAEREGNPIEGGARVQCGDAGAKSMIQRGFEITQNVGGDEGQIHWRTGRYPHPVDVFACFAIEISESGVGLRISEGAALDFEVIKVFPAAI